MILLQEVAPREQGRSSLLQALIAMDDPDGCCPRESDNQEEQGKQGGSAAAPLPPALGDTPVANTSQGQIRQVPSQVSGQASSGRIPVLRNWGQAFAKEIREPLGYMRIALPQFPP